MKHITLVSSFVRILKSDTCDMSRFFDVVTLLLALGISLSVLHIQLEIRRLDRHFSAT